MKIVVLDGYTENPGDLSWEALEALGELKVYDRVSYVESPVIAETIGDADVAITNKTPISKATIDACPNLKAIAVLATGYNVVDYAYAGEKGIPVMNVPTYGTQIVGQYAVGLLLEICSHYQHHSDTVKAGKWENNVDWCYWDFPMIELYGKTAGIIGLGRIGRTTAGILNALGMKVLAYDSFESEEGRKLAEYVELDRLFAESDVIFLHCPLFPATEGIIRIGCHFPALPAFPGNGGNHQQREYRKDEGWCDPDQQLTRPAGRRAGSGGCPEFRKDLCSRPGRGLHRTDQGRQPAPYGEELHHHSAYLLGSTGSQTANHGYHCRQREILYRRKRSECRQ